MDKQPYTPNRIRLYITLQSLVLLVCWIWFAAFWTFGFINYDWGDFEFWLLLAIACAGLYGLRPNLERAIDTAWLQGVNNAEALAARIARLKPIKRRINLFFSFAMLALLVGITIVWLVLFAGTTQVPPQT